MAWERVSAHCWAASSSPAEPGDAWGSSAIALVVAAVLLGTTIARPWINFSKRGGEEEAVLGYDALIANHNDDALRWYRDAIRMQPDSGAYWYNYAIALNRLQHAEEAKAAFRRASELDPSVGKQAGAMICGATGAGSGTEYRPIENRQIVGRDLSRQFVSRGGHAAG